MSVDRGDPRRRRERGSVSVVVVAGAAVVLVLTMGVADVARALTAAARARAAADAAALAAAQELAFPTGAVPTVVADGYAVANGGALERCTCEPGTFEAVVEVSVPVGALFLSTDDRRVTALARAVVDLPTE
ncbi:MAG TPA: pilus assembly protein TadG-related protein [Actinomycetota bacterium]|nr:pilus assembly protein TadG-related protein [Actinomycetota bacterium]